MAGGALILDPSTVSSGPVYLLIDASAADVSFIGRAYATQEEIDAHGGQEPGPLTDAEVDAIARGDTYLTFTTGGLGDVSQWDLLPGKYVVVTDDPVTLASQGGGRAPAGTLAVLTVVGGACVIARRRRSPTGQSPHLAELARSPVLSPPSLFRSAVRRAPGSVLSPLLSIPPLRRGSDCWTSQSQEPVPSYAVSFVVAMPTTGVQLAGVVPGPGAGGTALPSAD